MNRIRKIIITALLLFIPFVVSADEKTLRVYLFHQESCPHCKKEIQYLEELKNEYSNLDVVTYEVSQNVMNYNFMNRVIDKTGIVTNGQVPFTIIGTDYYIGFEDHVKKSIKDSIDKFLNDKNSIDIIAKVKNGEDVSNIKYNVDPKSTKVIPILGEIDAKKVSLPLVAIVIGAVDGFNPCAMWVLLFLISSLLGMKDRKRMWIIGVTFLLTSALVYMVIMLGWLEIVVNITTSILVRNIIACIAIIGGLVNLRTFIKTRNTSGCTILDDKKRTKVFDKIKNFTKEKSLFLALAGVITLAIGVNVVELACSAGLPFVFTQVLAINNITGVNALMYVFIYILFFLIDDLLIFIIAMTTLKLTGISNKYAKYSHLVGGILMIVIGLLLIIKPELIMFNF